MLLFTPEEATNDDPGGHNVGILHDRKIRFPDTQAKALDVTLFPDILQFNDGDAHIGDGLSDIIKSSVFIDVADVELCR